ncbi:MFS transporter, partial [Pseudomonas idahonensis]
GLASLAPPGESLLAARQLAGGDLAASAGSLPTLSREGLLHIYSQAFSQLLQVLMVITLLAALVVRVALHEPRHPCQARD